MSTISELEIILSRLEKCPINLFRVELEMFLNTLKSDTNINSVISHIIISNENKLGVKASTIVKDIQSSNWLDLSFANSAALRAAVGYQVCECMLGDLNPITCGKKAVAVGNKYAAYQGIARDLQSAGAIRVFSEIFLQPLVSYIRSTFELHHRILFLLSRYRQRSEWFRDDAKVSAILEDTGEIEKQLKREFFLYLFDNGIDFSIESESPAGGAEVDILAVLPELGPFPIEVKVFDGNKRDEAYISGGLAQACEYARTFNSSEAYYIVYNVAENTRIVLPGVSNESHVIEIHFPPLTINSIVINLRNTYPASQAKYLNSVNIPLPTLGN
ncbi:hypothetical protein ES703_91580 [subsurface metagenome]